MELEAKHQRLVEAVGRIYYAAHWRPDRTVEGADEMWAELRDAAGFDEGQAPTPEPTGREVMTAILDMD